VIAEIGIDQEYHVKIDCQRSGEWSIVCVEGRMDTTTAPAFERKMQELIAEGQKSFVLDLDRLEYVSSAGLRAVLTAGKKAKASGGQMACCNLQGIVRKVFEISGFTSVFPVYESLEAALKQS
jgi:anti-anti-sigma factor